MLRHRIRFEKEITTSWTEESIDTVNNYIIVKRVRAKVNSPGTQIALSIREVSGGANILDIPLEYSLADAPLDSIEDIYVKIKRDTFYIALKADVACSAEVLIEYEKYD